MVSVQLYISHFANLAHQAQLEQSTATSSTKITSTAFAALIWWLVPLVAVSGAIVYVIWTSRFKEKFDNETSRSVDKFQLFQQTLRETDSKPLE
jgi:type II secretory pathway component PulF